MGPKKASNLGGLNVLLGISGGVSAYKSVDLAGKLTAAGVSVKTVMTENACQLVTPKSFEAVTGSRVYTNLWNNTNEFEISHISLVDWADIVVVAPATANIIGKVAAGICDDLLSTVLCVCWRRPVILAAAMNTDMWENPAVQRNVKTVSGMGFELVGPERGHLACGTSGIGRMSEVVDILEAIKQAVLQVKNKKS